MPYEKDAREQDSHDGGSSKPGRGGPAELQTTSFARRLHQPGSPVCKASEPYNGLTPVAARGEVPNGHRTNPKGASQDESSGGEHGKSAEAAYPAYSEERILDAISKFSAYLREERERYRPEGRKLGDAASALFGKFFSPKLLRQVRVVALSGRRLANPAFYGQARAFGVFNLPEMAHKTSATFLDVIVFNERITNRELFHGLVHAAQVQVLGKRFFAELFVRGMMRTRSYSLTPMKAQAFALDARFAANPAGAFSVEDEVRAWLSEARY